MKKQLALAILAALVALPSLSAWAQSNGEIFMLADVARGNSGKACPFWNMRWKEGNPNQQSPFGVCQPPVINVYGQLLGASAGGITGAEFRGTIGPSSAPDAGYIILEIPNPTATTRLGLSFFPPDPAPRGMNIAWAECQTGTSGVVLLSTLIVIPTTGCGPGVTPPQLNLSAGQHFDPSNVFFRCPLFTLCDAPAFTKVCLGTNITLCQTPVPPFPIASMCSTSGAFALNDPANPTNLDTCVNIKEKAGVPSGSINNEPETWGNVKALYR